MLNIQFWKCVRNFYVSTLYYNNILSTNYNIILLSTYYVLTWRRGVHLQRTGHVRPKRWYGVVSVRKPAVGLRRGLRWIGSVIDNASLLFDDFADLRFWSATLRPRFSTFEYVCHLSVSYWKPTQNPLFQADFFFNVENLLIYLF